MRILLLGGSNTGKVDGFAAALRDRYGPSAIVNRFLGASTSLYGTLMADRHLIASGATHIVFEYAINDASFVKNNAYDPATLRWTLSLVCSNAAQHGARVLFVVMCPRYCLRDYVKGRATVVDIYRSVAAEYGASVFDVTAYLLETMTFEELPQAYADDMHYRSDCARAFGDVICDQLSAGTVAPLAWPEGIVPGYRQEIDFIPATDMRVIGEAVPVNVRTTAIEGTALRLGRGSSVEFQAPGTLLGIVANTFENSGYIRFSINGTQVIKNTFDGFFKVGRPRVFLKQISTALPAHERSAVRISADVTAKELVEFKPEYSMHHREPMAKDSEWTVEILSAVYRRWQV